MAELLHEGLLRVSQLDTIEFMKQRNFCAVFCDLGFGKTVTSLTACRDLFATGDIKKVLIVAPLRVARDTWPDEIGDWEHTTDITFKFIEGDAQARTRAARGNEMVHIINQENFVWLVKRAGKRWPYDSIIFDDTKGFKSGKLKTTPRAGICTLADECAFYETERSMYCELSADCEVFIPGDYGECVVHCTDFVKSKKPGPQSCTVLCKDYKQKPSEYTRYGALLAIRPQIKRLVHLTGTPTSKELLDLWPMIHTLDMGKRLGRSYNAYKQKYFIKDHNGFGWSLRPGAKERIFEAISDICISIECEEELTPRYDIPVSIELPPDAAALYDELEREFLVSIEDDEVTALNSGVLSGKLLQVCGGAVYYGDTREKKWARLHDEKLNALDSIIEKHKGEPILVGYNFAHELERLKERYPHGIDIRDSKTAVADWNAGRIPLMFAHPESAGHGLNLQKGPGRTLVWFGLNWALDLNTQLNKRLHRPGQLRDVFIYYLIATGRADERVMESVTRKGAVQKELLDAVKMDAKRRNRKTQKGGL